MNRQNRFPEYMSLLTLMMLMLICAQASLLAAPPAAQTTEQEGASIGADASVKPTTPEPAGAQTKGKTAGELPRTFGIGVRLGGFHFGVGADARYWTKSKFGVGVGFSRYSYSYLTSIQISPSVLYSIRTLEFSPAVSMRLYAGGGISFYRTSVSYMGYGASATATGGQGFGGAEFGFAKIPRLAVSADLGYYTTMTPFAHYADLGGFNLSATAHWFIK